ncbi:MAG: N-formylglutamate amidohydrolase [Rhodospirillaceae bacterium]|nr:N-formylglutamate amidohydrolase [Rhodospirillaceae bacterium]
MSSETTRAYPDQPANDEAVAVLMPPDLRVPLVFASPHSGRTYPAEFIGASSLDLAALRKSEDCYVDELFADVTDLGAPLVKALLPRAYLDVNREPYELDPEMFDGPLPPFVNTASARVAAGLGTVARIVATRREIYRGKLSFDEVERRLAVFYQPYHRAVRAMINRVHDRFGFCVLIDCHSMPSSGLPLGEDSAPQRVDMVLGDRSGLSCHPLVTDAIEESLRGLGYRLLRNNPYAGGFTTQHYGDPANGIHAVQIEINRAIYMDEATLQRRAGFAKLRADLRGMAQALAAGVAGATSALHYQRLSAE